MLEERVVVVLVMRATLFNEGTKKGDEADAATPPSSQSPVIHSDPSFSELSTVLALVPEPVEVVVVGLVTVKDDEASQWMLWRMEGYEDAAGSAGVLPSKLHSSRVAVALWRASAPAVALAKAQLCKEAEETEMNATWPLSHSHRSATSSDVAASEPAWLELLEDWVPMN